MSGLCWLIFCLLSLKNFEKCDSRIIFLDLKINSQSEIFVGLPIIMVGQVGFVPEISEDFTTLG